MGSSWAAEYHDLFREDDDIGFYRSLARRAGPRALDIGVGTGRVALPLAADGCAVVGVDGSMELLRVASDRVSAAGGRVLGNVRLLYGDIRDFSLPREDRFDLAYASSGTLNWCKARTELANAFACVRDHVRVGGILAFDLKQVRESEMDGVHRLEGVAPSGDGGEVVKHTAYLQGRRMGDCVVHSTYERFDLRGRSVERLAERATVHMFDPSEVAELLHLGGFEDVERYSDHHGGRTAGSLNRLAVYTCHRGP